MMIGSVYAQQTQVTDNLIYSTANPAPTGATYNWSGFIVTNSTGGGLSGGNVPGYNTSTHTFMFGYTQATIAYSIAINSALSGTGIQVGGINYGLEHYNQDFARGTLSTTVTLRSNTNTVLNSYSHNLEQTTNGWTWFNQTQSFASPYSLANVGNLTMSFSKKPMRANESHLSPDTRNLIKGKYHHDDS